MLNKSLENIDLKDLETLVNNSVAEGKTIEYKKLLPGNSDEGRKEFLSDVSSFANTSGGDLIFGVIEENGIATKIEGISVSNADEEIRKYDNLIRDGIEPRIQSVIHKVKIDDEKFVFIIRINPSWTGPHRVKFRGHDKFYARNSVGKYPMDTSELRTAFNLSATLVEKIKKFRTERIFEIMADNTPIPFHEGVKFILHLIPVEAFSPNVGFDIKSLKNISSKLYPIRCSAPKSRINLEGILWHSSSGQENSPSFVQLYRNGIIEAVVGWTLNKDTGKKDIQSKFYEKALLEFMPKYLNALKELNVNTPIFISLTVTGAKGFKITDKGDYGDYDYGNPIDRDPLMLPETMIETFDFDAQKKLRPMFDLIWNACGYPQSPNFDEQDKWIV
jgi:hypothetical protein